MSNIVIHKLQLVLHSTNLIAVLLGSFDPVILLKYFDLPIANIMFRVYAIPNIS